VAGPPQEDWEELSEGWEEGREDWEELSEGWEDMYIMWDQEMQELDFDVEKPDGVGEQLMGRNNHGHDVGFIIGELGELDEQAPAIPAPPGMLAYTVPGMWGTSPQTTSDDIYEQRGEDTGNAIDVLLAGVGRDQAPWRKLLLPQIERAGALRELHAEPGARFARQVQEKEMGQTLADFEDDTEHWLTLRTTRREHMTGQPRFHLAPSCCPPRFS